jgi:hypothetical protein
MAHGPFAAAMAERELAGAGIMVLQLGGPVQDDLSWMATPKEGPLYVAGFEAAIEKLSSDGTVDASKVGIVGFSRTVYHVMEALTTSKVHFSAATICDGLGYWQFLTSVDLVNTTAEDVAMIGAPPVGEGLRKWMTSSPEFHLDKVTTPLRIEGEGRASVATMWEPYALLRYLKKPVDLILLVSSLSFAPKHLICSLESSKYYYALAPIPEQRSIFS